MADRPPVMLRLDKSDDFGASGEGGSWRRVRPEGEWTTGGVRPGVTVKFHPEMTPLERGPLGSSSC